jgi:hypothetical protein
MNKYIMEKGVVKLIKEYTKYRIEEALTALYSINTKKILNVHQNQMSSDIKIYIVTNNRLLLLTYTPLNELRQPKSNLEIYTFVFNSECTKEKFVGEYLMKSIEFNNTFLTDDDTFINNYFNKLIDCVTKKESDDFLSNLISQYYVEYGDIEAIESVESVEDIEASENEDVEYIKHGENIKLPDDLFNLTHNAKIERAMHDWQDLCSLLGKMNISEYGIQMSLTYKTKLNQDETEDEILLQLKTLLPKNIINITKTFFLIDYTEITINIYN